ncbi:MAG: MerR family transcriptional regulator [Acidobacteria bacterium]|nr:MerR family transcriptional regulator [Acidobacteriota bacterium]
MAKSPGTSARDKAPAPRVGLLTVGETARIVGVSPSTLRLWENVGLISPARSDGRYRLYSRKLLALLKRIKYLRDVKLLNLPGIRQILRTAPADAASGNGRRTRHGQHPRDLGRKLRQLRKRQALGVVEAAKRAKISAGFLSAVELSRANPSVATLQRLAATYGTTVLDFYDVPKHSGRLLRPRQRRVIQTQSGVRIELLSIGAKRLESQIFRVPPGAGSDGAYSHEGEEFMYMLAGTLELWLDELECHTLHEGDSFWFASTMGHRWYNPSSQEAVLLWINTPPTF